MANVLLINPPWTKKGGNIWKTVSSCWPSQALAIIAAVLEQEGHEVKILDSPAMHVALNDLKQYLKDNYNKFNPDFVGISITTVLFEFGTKATEICKEIWPNCKTVVGGPHPTSEPEETIKIKTIDFVVRDEGEYTFKEIINGEDIKKILGLTYKNNDGKIIHNLVRPFLKRLDELPMPAYHLLPMDKYYPATSTYRKLPAMSLVVSRGCPGKCTFCFQPYGALVRQRSAKKIFEEVKLLHEDFGINEICFYDDNFCTYQENVREFCSLLSNYCKEKNIKIPWGCFSRVDWIQEETIKAMKDSGCHTIMFGVESANEQVLKNIKKNINLDMVIHVNKLIQKHGISTRAAFMFGNPGETKETMRETIEFAIKLDPDVVIFNVLAPNPGTEVYKWAKENGYLKEKKWEDYDLYTPIMTLPTVSPETIQEYYKLGYRKFYLRPSYLFRRLVRLKDPIELKNALGGMRAVFSVITET